MFDTDDEGVSDYVEYTKGLNPRSQDTDSNGYKDSLKPTVTTIRARNIEPNSAQLNGNLDDLGTATEVVVYFEWGGTSGDT